MYNGAEARIRRLEALERVLSCCLLFYGLEILSRF